MWLALWRLPTVFFIVSVGGGIPENCGNRGLWPLPKTALLALGFLDLLALSHGMGFRISFLTWLFPHYL